jgi:hypothetical protein
MSPEAIAHYKERLFKNKNVYEELGYYSKGPLQQLQGWCPNCLLSKTLIADHCSHKRC